MSVFIFNVGTKYMDLKEKCLIKVAYFSRTSHALVFGERIGSPAMVNIKVCL